MAILAPFANDAMLSALATTVNAGTANPNATLQIYTAPRPNGPVDGATGTLLATILLPDPAMSGPVNNELLLLLSGLTTSITADGRAAWARFRTKDNTTIMDLDVGVVGSGADIELELVDLLMSDVLNLGNIPLRFECP